MASAKFSLIGESSIVLGAVQVRNPKPARKSPGYSYVTIVWLGGSAQIRINDGILSKLPLSKPVNLLISAIPVLRSVISDFGGVKRSISTLGFSGMEIVDFEAR